jgi:hypothetical protein
MTFGRKTGEMGQREMEHKLIKNETKTEQSYVLGSHGGSSPTCLIS